MNIINDNKLKITTKNGRQIVYLYDVDDNPYISINLFLTFLFLKGYLYNTLKTYALALSQYLLYCKLNVIDYANLTDFRERFEGILQGFIIWMEKVSPNKSPITRLKIIRKVLWFYEYLILRAEDKDLAIFIKQLIEEYDRPGVFAPDAPAKIRYYERITYEKFALLLKHCPNLRDQVILNIMYYVGLRSGELLTLRWEDLKPSENLIIVNGAANIDARAYAKSGYRLAAASNEIFYLLGKYKDELKNTNRLTSEYVFVSLSGEVKSIKYGAIRSLLRSLETKTGIHLHSHIFRKSCAQNLLLRGASRKAIKDQLGHTSPQIGEEHYIGFLWDDMVPEILKGAVDLMDGGGI